MTPEEKALFDQGVEAAKGHELEIPSYPKDRLQDFVRKYVAGTIYTDNNVPENVLGMVFMPLVFGALQPQGEALEAMEAAMGASGEKPEEPKEPETLKLPKEPPSPEEILRVEPDPERIRQIQSSIEWTDSPPSAMDDYLAEIEAKNLALRSKREAMLAKHEKAVEAWAQRCRDLEAGYETAMGEYEIKAESYQKDMEVWEAKKTEEDAFRKGFMHQYVSTLGCVWEDIAKAGPRAINGCPIFFSMSMMNKSDFKRARKAIEREMERQKEIEV